MDREDIAWALSQIQGDLIVEFRDKLAMAALTGLLPKLPLIDQTGEHGIKVDDKIAHNLEIARSCYAIADAMLEARKK